jgi:imidazolonepropionase-like amidohydrolase
MYDVSRYIYGALKRAYKAGLEIVLGKDAGSMSWDVNQAREVEYLVKKVGFSPMDAIRAGTSVAAELLDQLQQIGALKPGVMIRNDTDD